MGCSDDGADTRLAVGYGGIADALGENAGRKELTRKFVGQRGFANDHGRDRCFAQAGIEPELLQAFFEKLRVCPEVIDQLWFLFQDLQGRDRRGRHRRRMRGGKEKGPGAVAEEVDRVARRAHVSAERADRLGQRSHLNVDAPVQVEMVDRPAAVAAQHA